MRDFDAARSSFITALRLNPSPLIRTKIQEELGNLLIFSGKYDEAISYFKPEDEERISYRTIAYVNSLLYSAKIDSAVAYLDLNILKTDPNLAYFNDIFEMHDLVVDYYADGTREDKLAFELFFKAERLINEFDIDGAIQLLEKIDLNNSEALISPLVSLRLAFIYIDLKDYEKSLGYALDVSSSSVSYTHLTLPTSG